MVAIIRRNRSPPDFALSFVDNKKNKQWVWLARDAVTCEIVGVYIGARDEEGAQGLWNSLSPVYRGAGDAPPPVNVQLLIPTFGQRMPQFSLARNTVQWAKKQVKLAILSDSTTLLGSDLGA